MSTYISLQYLRGDILAGLGRNEERRGRPVEEGIGLDILVCLLHPVTELLEVEFRLHVPMLPALHGIGRAGTELLLGTFPGGGTTAGLLLPLDLNRIWLSTLRNTAIVIII
jgi:hypothetical protein